MVFPPRYELFMDDLPIWGFVGEYVEGDKAQADAGKAEDAVRASERQTDFVVASGGRHVLNQSSLPGSGVHLHA